MPAEGGLRDSETAKAVGLAGAMILNNIVALGSTFVFARELDDYGSLGALISYLLILTVFGQAMQVATAREGVLGHLGVGDDLLATIKQWSKVLLIVTVVLTLVSIALQAPIAAAVGVKKYSWAAAAGIPAGCMYLQVSILRGALQGIGDYKSVGVSLVGEQTVRLIAGATLAATFLGVTGAYLGSLLSYVVMSLYCWTQLRRHVALSPRRTDGRVTLGLWTHFRRAWAPIAGLSVIAVLQNIDLISAKHQFSKDTASAYAATAVAAKVLIWVAIGAGFYLVPEVSRRRAAGEDTRPVLAGGVGDRRRLRHPLPADLRRRAAPAAQRRLRLQARHRLRVPARARNRVHGAGRDVSRDPVHARAQAHLVPDPARHRGDRRADRPVAEPAAPNRLRRHGARDPGARRDPGLRDGAATGAEVCRGCARCRGR